MTCRQVRLFGLLLAATGCIVYAQTGVSQRAIKLNVVAVDSGGRPVPDLAASDFTVFDNGTRQQIVSLRLNKGDNPRPLVILFDLMNSGASSRGAVWNAIKTSVGHVEFSGPLYLYLLTESGSLYPVHAFPARPDAQADADASWTKDIGPLMNDAMQKASQLRPQDFRSASPIYLEARFRATYQALDNLREQMAVLQGARELLWITYGIPSTIHLADRSWFDCVPLLRQIGARFVQSETTVYTADPGINIGAGILNRDSLDILTGSTGGHAFPTIDLNRALNEIEAGARMNYSIEFQPPSDNRDGKYHKLRVTVARKGVHVQTELGYYAVAGS